MLDTAAASLVELLLGSSASVLAACAWLLAPLLAVLRRTDVLLLSRVCDPLVGAEGCWPDGTAAGSEHVDWVMSIGMTIAAGSAGCRSAGASVAGTFGGVAADWLAFGLSASPRRCSGSSATRTLCW